jgi:FdhD protein
MRIDVERVGLTGRSATSDLVAVEEPLEIRVSREGELPVTVAVTMRTPGDDGDLAIGYLFTEGIIRRREEVAGVYPCRGGAIRVELAAGIGADLSRLERHSFTSSSCGACGKTSTAALRATPAWPLPDRDSMIGAEFVHALPGLLREAQVLFAATGGLHASALYDLDARLIVLREDVGRHNALDKVVGAELVAGRLPADERILIVSGRVSFELVQKALMAGIPVVAAIGAPSSLAVEIARESGMMLIGFVRADRFNVYSGVHRLSDCHPEERSDEGSSFSSERTGSAREQRARLQIVLDHTRP